MKTREEKLKSTYEVINGEIARVLELDLQGFTFVQIEEDYFPVEINIKFVSPELVKEVFNIPDDAYQAYDKWLIANQYYPSYVGLSETPNHFKMLKQEFDFHLTTLEYCMNPEPITIDAVRPKVNSESYAYYDGELYPWGVGHPLLTELHIRSKDYHDIDIKLTVDANSEVSDGADWTIENTISFIDHEMPYNLDKDLSAVYLAKNILPKELYKYANESTFNKDKMNIIQNSDNVFHITLKIKDLISIIEAYVASTGVEF